MAVLFLFLTAKVYFDDSNNSNSVSNSPATTVPDPRHSVASQSEIVTTKPEFRDAPPGKMVVQLDGQSGEADVQPEYIDDELDAIASNVDVNATSSFYSDDDEKLQMQSTYLPPISTSPHSSVLPAVVRASLTLTTAETSTLALLLPATARTTGATIVVPPTSPTTTSTTMSTEPLIAPGLARPSSTWSALRSSSTTTFVTPSKTTTLSSTTESTITSSLSADDRIPVSNLVDLRAITTSTTYAASSTSIPTTTQTTSVASITDLIIISGTTTSSITASDTAFSTTTSGTTTFGAYIPVPITTTQEGKTDNLIPSNRISERTHSHVAYTPVNRNNFVDQIIISLPITSQMTSSMSSTEVTSPNLLPFPSHRPSSTTTSRFTFRQIDVDKQKRQNWSIDPRQRDPEITLPVTSVITLATSYVSGERLETSSIRPTYNDSVSPWNIASTDSTTNQFTTDAHFIGIDILEPNFVIGISLIKS